MKAVKLSLIISFLIYSSGYLLFSKENKDKNDIKSGEEEVKSIIKNFATIDNRLDNIILNINSENISDEIIELKKDIDRTNDIGTKILISTQTERIDLNYCKMMKIYSEKINKKLIRVKKEFTNRDYRMAPDSKKGEEAGNDLVSVNKNYIKTTKSIDNIISSSDKLNSTYKWLYISNR